MPFAVSRRGCIVRFSRCFIYLANNSIFGRAVGEAEEGGASTSDGHDRAGTRDATVGDRCVARNRVNVDVRPDSLRILQKNGQTKIYEKNEKAISS